MNRSFYSCVLEGKHNRFGVVGMSETAQVIELLRQQLETQRKQMETLVAALSAGGTGLSTNPVPTSQTAVVSIPSFVPFDSSSELWHDYWARFQTFAGANSVPADKTAQVFLTNQSRVTYKLLFNLAAQQSPPKDVNALSMDEIVGYMKDQFDPTHYIVRERRDLSSGQMCAVSRERPSKS